MMGDCGAENPLGVVLPSPEKYSPEVLYPIPRAPARESIGMRADLQMFGFDLWQAFELSWLSEEGKPQVAFAEFEFPSDSPSIIESKSLKLYLNSLNHERFATSEVVADLICRDLSNACGSAVQVFLRGLDDYRRELSSESSADIRPCESLDAYPLLRIVSVVDESLLQSERRSREEAGREDCVVSDLFRSNCPVTNQPDWASVVIRYTGVDIDPSSLLSYLCSYRAHQGYHEECAERIFKAISERCEPDSLFVAMNYLRRGGLDINVYRSSERISRADRIRRSVRQ